MKRKGDELSQDIANPCSGATADMYCEPASMFNYVTPIDFIVGHKAAITGVAICDNTIVSSSCDQTLGIYNPTPSSFSCFSTDNIVSTCVDFCNDTQTIICGCADGSIRLWNLAPASLISCINSPPSHSCPNGIKCIMLLENKILAGHENGRVSLSYLETCSHLCYFTDSQDSSATTCLACYSHLNEHFIISGHANGKIKIWNYTLNNVIQTFQPHSQAVTGIKVIGNNIVSASHDGNINILDIRNGHNISTIHELNGSINCLATYEHYIITGCENRCIAFWDIEQANCVYNFLAHTAAVTCLDIFGDRLVSGGADNTIKLWQLK